MNQLSDYAKFHLKYMGYNIYDNYKKKIISKYALWHGKRHLCLAMLNQNLKISRYELIDKVGWKNGKRILKKIKL